MKIYLFYHQGDFTNDRMEKGSETAVQTLGWVLNPIGKSAAIA